MTQDFTKARCEVPHPYLTLMGLYLGSFTGMLSETSLNIALPQLGVVFGIDTAVTQWLVVGYMLVIGLMMPFAGILMKWFSVRKLTFFALGSFFVGSIISAAAPSFAVVLVGRLIQGIGTGLLLPMMFAVSIEVFAPQKLGSAMGLAALIIMFAPAIGPTASGIILGAFSWRAIFIMFAVVLAAGMVFAAKSLVNPYELTKPRIDAASCVLSIIAFGGLVLGVGLASSAGWMSVQVAGPIVCGIIALVLYVRRQWALETPIIDVRIFKLRGFCVGCALMMLNFGITLSAMFLLPQFIQNAMGIPVAMAGLIMLPGGIINAFVSFAAGNIYDRVGAKIPARIGFCLSVLGAILFLFAGTTTSIAYLILAHIILMIGVPLAMSPCQTSALSCLPRNNSGDGSTALNTMQQVLGAVATAVATCLLGAGQAAFMAAGGTSTAEAFATGAHWGFAFTLVLAVLGAVISFTLLKQEAKRADKLPEASSHEHEQAAATQSETVSANA